MFISKIYLESRQSFLINQKKISVTFVSLDEKNIFMSKANKDKLTAEDIDISCENSAVFFNDQMTISNNTLFLKRGWQ